MSFAFQPFVEVAPTTADVGLATETDVALALAATKIAVVGTRSVRFTGNQALIRFTGPNKALTFWLRIAKHVDGTILNLSGNGDGGSAIGITCTSAGEISVQGNSGEEGFFQLSPEAIALDTWYFFALLFPVGGSIPELYFVESGGSAFTQFGVETDNGFSLGTVSNFSLGNADASFNGWMCDVKGWDTTALTPTEALAERLSRDAIVTVGHFDTWYLDGAATATESVSGTHDFNLSNTLSDGAAAPIEIYSQGSAETDAGLAPTAAKVVGYGVSAEVDSALGLSATKTVAAGIALEVDSAHALAATKLATVGLSSEANAALSLNALKLSGIGLATETDEGLALVGEIIDDGEFIVAPPRHTVIGSRRLRTAIGDPRTRTVAGPKRLRLVSL
jgi:hypothetical protein